MNAFKKFAAVNDRRSIASRFLPRMVALMFAILLVFNAGAQDAAGKFPEADRVAADYSDPAQAYVALNLLWDVLHEKSSSAAAVSKRSTYYNVSQGIRNKQLSSGTPAGSQFDERVVQLTIDKTFRAAVLAKYGVAGVPVEAVPAAMQSTDMSDAMIKAAFLKGLPFAVAALLAMYLIVKLMVGGTKSPTADSASLPADGLPGLPESLRVVRVPRLTYTIGAVSGKVLEKESSVETTVRTTAEQGQVYSMGNQIHSTPGKVTTSVSSVQKDVMWVRSPEGKEMSWTFGGGAFLARAGHWISAVVRLLPGGGSEFLMAYNHTTGQLVKLGNGAHGTRYGRWAWLVSALVGAAGFAVAIGVILHSQPGSRREDPVDRMLEPVAFYVEGLVVAGILGIFIVLWVKSRLFSRRQARFEREYAPGLAQFLDARTGALGKVEGRM